MASYRRQRPELRRLSAERVEEELSKIMEQVERPSRALWLWRESGALETLAPPLARLDALTLASLDCLPRPVRVGGGGGGPMATARADARRLNRLAALFVGQSEADTARSLKELRFSNQDTAWIAGLAGAWAAGAAEMEQTLGSHGHAQ